MTRRRTVVDLFAGAGGWEEGLAELGHHATGLETDAQACETAQAAGHRRERLDVAATDPQVFGPVWGLIGSPPCQAYSMAGKGLGRADQEHVVACANELAEGRDLRARRLADCRDPRSLLTIEPLRWALALRPEWIALEQVPPVLELWELFAGLLGAVGYRCDAGVLSAERYGVPQTRRRAYLIANRRRRVTLPAPTHRSYDPHHPDRVVEEERDLLPWVSMADALGLEPEAVNQTHCHLSDRRPHGMERVAAHPSRTVDTKAGWWTITRPRDCERRGHHRRGQGRSRPVGLDVRQRGARVRPTSAPAPTMLASGLAKGTPIWVDRRPADDHRVGDRRPTTGSGASQQVTVEQAAALQGFRPDYPWQGSRTAQFMQVGNAVCPPMARVVLAAAIGLKEPADA
jgi:DNA (cytosine-5)-methyltransferase 1